MDKRKVWFDSIQKKTPLFLPYCSQKTLIKFAYLYLQGVKSSNKEFNEWVITDQEPRILFLSISDGNAQAEVFFGRGEGVLNSLQDALDKCLKKYGDAKKGATKKKKTVNIKWVKLDFVEKVKIFNEININKPIDIDRSLEGLAFIKASNIALLSGQLQGSRLVNSKNKIWMKNFEHYYKDNETQLKRLASLKKQKTTTLFTFTTQSVFYDGKEVRKTYRGHRVNNKLTPALMLQASEQAGEYLTQSVDKTGRFAYSYRPLQHDYPNKYNILRHAGTIYAMLELYEKSKNKKLFEASKRAIKYLMQSIETKESDGLKLAFVVEDDQVKLGGNALAILALTQYTKVSNDKQYLPRIRELALWINSIQIESGEFVVFKQGASSGKISKFISGYYPGEAIFALASLYPIDPNEMWLDIARRGALCLIKKNQDVDQSNLVHDHWLLYGMNRLYKLTEDQKYVDYSMLLGKAIAASQIQKSECKDWNGGFYNPPRSTPTSIRIEGICGAYELARMVDDKQMMRTIFTTIEEGIKFILECQYYPESVMYLVNPQRALGGIHQNLTIFETRIDYVQHAISAFLGFYDIISEKSNLERMM